MIIKRILLMYIMCTARVMSPYVSSIPSGRLWHVLSIYFDRVLREGFPLSNPRFGSRMSLALMRCSFIIGQFGSGSLSM